MGNFNRNRGFSRTGSGKPNYRNKSRSSKPFERSSGGFGTRDSRRPLELHQATCAKCGSKCEVPFRPNNRKPVFCKDCFQKEGNPEFRGNESPRQSAPASKDELSEINQKLDRILKILEED